MLNKKLWAWSVFLLGILTIGASSALAGEADIKIPDLNTVYFTIFGKQVSGLFLLYCGLGVCAIGALFGLVQYQQTKSLPVHSSMRAVSNTIWETCKTYLAQQGKFLIGLWLLIAICMVYYFVGLPWNNPATKLTHGELIRNGVIVLLCSILGILGSYGVAWFGIRINTQANLRAAFSALRGFPYPVLSIPLRSGMSVGLLLVSVELFFMICILCFLPPTWPALVSSGLPSENRSAPAR
jgi:K(+)-stimulated pyrophosphate-energized sodium pump